MVTGTIFAWSHICASYAYFLDDSAKNVKIPEPQRKRRGENFFCQIYIPLLLLLPCSDCGRPQQCSRAMTAAAAALVSAATAAETATSLAENRK